MPNYAMKFGTSEAARMLNVERDIIKTWAYQFSDYLKPQANPPKGKIRQFSITDIRVFAYVSMYWEDNPDIESIKYGLNANNHYEQPFNEFVVEATPLFRELPEDIDDTWKGVVLGGEFELSDMYTLADSYKLDGDKLVEIAHNNEKERELFCPAIYNYRHSTELYLKAIIDQEVKSHDLLWLLKELKALLEAEFNALTPEWFDNVIISFNDFDSSGTTFRYGGISDKDEIFVDLLHVKTLMMRVANSFKRIREERTKKYI